MNEAKHPRRAQVDLDKVQPSPLAGDETRVRVSLCRCWRSSKMPLCDGAHKNIEGDQVGPVVVTWPRDGVLPPSAAKQ